MHPFRFLLSAIVAAGLAMSALAPSATADTKITVGIVPGGNTLHLPTYVAMERGFFKKEGLDASWVKLTGKALVTAGLAGEVDFVPIPAGGALAALRGAPIVYVVGQSLSSQWQIVTDKNIAKPEDLKDKTIALGQPGGANYDEGATVLSRFFHLDAGKDYKVISFQSEPGEVAALINGDVQAALLTAAATVKAQKAGFKILLTTNDYLPRLGGSMWALRPFVEKNPAATKAFIRAIADAVTYIRTNKQGTMPIFKTYLGIDDPQEQSLLWDDLHDDYDAGLPPKLFRDIFASRIPGMISTGQWQKGKPVPDTEKFVDRKLLDAALKEAHYVAPPPKATTAAK
jgi:ABC-type nitrate/sulfonate/bicarbonate transport system substrate-binding protein